MKKKWLIIILSLLVVYMIIGYNIAKKNSSSVLGSVSFGDILKAPIMKLFGGNKQVTAPDTSGTGNAG